MRTVLLALLAVPTLGAAQDAARLDQIVRARVDNRTFMGAVLVARGDKPLLSSGYGSANLEWNQPNAPTTKFRIASLAKQFTAAAILLLEDRGKLEIEDPMRSLMPDAPAAWDQVTIFHLLTHSSGIPNYTNSPSTTRTGNSSRRP